jgi:hypothetical protein
MPQPCDAGNLLYWSTLCEQPEGFSGNVGLVILYARPWKELCPFADFLEKLPHCSGIVDFRQGRYLVTHG